jgi:hypothetical protein
MNRFKAETIKNRVITRKNYDSMAQKNYFAIVNQETGSLLTKNGNLPIFWMRKIANDVAKNYPGYVVVPVDKKELKQLILKKQ